MSIDIDYYKNIIKNWSDKTYSEAEELTKINSNTDYTLIDYNSFEKGINVGRLQGIKLAMVLFRDELMK